MVIVGNRKESLDQLALTKAAAWAWYERGSWFDQKSILESDRRRSQDYTPRPSRYKLEAMKKPQKENHGRSQSFDNNLTSCTKNFHNSLLDMYEIQRITKEIECSFQNHLKSVDGFDYGGRRIVHSVKDKKSRRTKPKGFFIRHGVMCGSSSDDVVEQANSIVGPKHLGKR